MIASLLSARDRSATVRSAGFLAGGRYSPAEVETVLNRWGLNPPSHVSIQVTRSELTRADLILGMERAHVREAVVLEPTVWRRTFTLKEFVRRGESLGSFSQRETLPGWLDRVHEGRQHVDLLGHSASDDIADPFGRKIAAFEATFLEIDGLARRLVELMFPAQ